MKIVLIIWHDAHAGPNGWTYLDELEDKDPCIVNSVGYLIEYKKHKKRNYVALMQSSIGNYCGDHILYIPKNMIKNIINLTEETNVEKNNLKHNGKE